ncbi:MAG: DUF445 family protein [Balneolaceae bacterium]|nr:DUF445 family protein [Balneolaceae bacterium]
MDEERQLQTDEQSNGALEVAKEKTRRYARHLWQIVSRYSARASTGDEVYRPQDIPERFEYKHPLLLTLLGVVPYLLVAAFGVSLFWDFEGVSYSVQGYILEFEGLLKILSVSGLIGFLTNWLAITMLFKPTERRPILGYGLIPAQKDRIAFRLAQAVSNDLINPEIIKRRINETKVISRYRAQATRYIRSIIDAPEFRSELKKWLVNYVDEMIADQEIRAALAEKILLQIEESVEDNSVEQIALKAYSFIKGREMQKIIEEALIKLPTSVESGLDKMDDLLDQLPEKVDEHSEVIENMVTTLLYKLINQLDVHSLVEDNLREYDEQRISRIIQGATNEQLRYIQYLGAVLGTVGGLVIWKPALSLLILGMVAVMILSADAVLYRLRR